MTSPKEQSLAATRVRQAASRASPAETLRELARDPDVVVRAAVAINQACGPDITDILAADGDERIRALLAARVARLLPELDERERCSAAERIEATLTTLAHDETTRVRAAIAEAIKAMPNAPRALVLLLARDSEVEVSKPIVRLSPVLTDADLLALLATPPLPATALTIANRPGIGPAISDAIATFADAPTIRALLSNHSACIMEGTLDTLVGRAKDYPDWHSPLVRRPSLSGQAVRAMAQFLTIDLLRTLATRTDLDPADISALQRRLADEDDHRPDDKLLAEAAKLKATRSLTEAVVLEAARNGDNRRVKALLAIAGGVTVPIVQRVLDLRSPKAIVSLAWFCGFSMRAAISVQTLLAQLPSDTILQPGHDGGFPLTRDEMEWQMELLNDPAGRGTDTWPAWSGRTVCEPA